MKKFFFIVLLMSIFNFVVHAQSIKQEMMDMQVQFEKLTYLDNAEDTIFAQMQKKIAQTNGVEQMMWHNYFAKHLELYYEQQQYQIFQRTTIINNKEALNLPISEWDWQTIANQAIFHYKKSLQNQDLLYEQDVNQFKELFSTIHTEDKKYNSSLFEIFAYNALFFYDRIMAQMPISQQEFNIDNEKYFSTDLDFFVEHLTEKDTLSRHYLYLQLIDRLLQFYAKQNDYLMQIHVNLLKIDYLQRNSTLSNKDDLCLQSLLTLENKYKNQIGYDEICYQIGLFYQNRAEQYNKDYAPQYQQDYVSALNWYNKTLELSSTSLYVNNAKCNIQNISMETIAIQHRKKVLPQQKSLFLLETRNIDTIYAAIVSMSKEEYEQLRTNYYQTSKKEQVIHRLINKNFIKQWSIVVPHNNDYRKVKFDCICPELSTGNYVILLSKSDIKKQSDKQDILFEYFEVSPIGIFLCRKNENKFTYFVYNEQTGKPIENATVEIWKQNYNKKEKVAILSSDKNGQCTFQAKSDKGYSQFYAKAYYEKTSAISDNTYFYRHSSEIIKNKYSAYTFTDRAIYRPQQKIYFKSIIVQSDSNHNVFPNQICVVALFDSNGQIVDSISLKTNEFGSISGHFIIPKNVLNGMFMIQIKFGKQILNNKFIRVEEYKRPSFEILINQPDSIFKLDEKVKISGKLQAYAGYAIEQANISYRIVRQARFPYWKHWHFMPSEPQKEIAHGNIQTNNNGEFFIDFLAESNQNMLKYNPVYHYKIIITATDVNGEMQTEEQIISVGTKSLLIHVDIPEEIEIQKNKSYSFSVSANNIAGKPQTVNLKYQIEKLIQPKQFLFERNLPSDNVIPLDSIIFSQSFPQDAYLERNSPLYWKTLKKVQEGEFITDTNSLVILQDIEKWEGGYYRLTLLAKDKFGEIITEERVFFVNNIKSKQCIQYNAIKMSVDNLFPIVGDTLHIQLSSYLKDAYVVFEILQNEHTSSRIYKLNCEKINIPLIITKEHLNQIGLRALLIQNGHYYQVDKIINVSKEKPQTINVEFCNFRNYLLPGETEQWKIKITDNQGKKIKTELLCSMYDASLDAFAPNKWDISLPSVIQPLKWQVFNQNANYGSSSAAFSFDNNLIYRNLDVYEWKKLFINRKNRYMLYSTKAGRQNDIMFKENVVSEEAMDATADGGNIEFEGIENTESPRVNFSETAFFFPHLNVDNEGYVVFSATMPDALTKWKMCGCIHDKNMNFNIFEKNIYTQKPLMIVPNFPRFFREGDTLFFTAKIVNLSQEKQHGKVSLSFMNSETEQEIFIVQGNSFCDFDIEAGNSKVVDFKIIIPKNISIITYKIMAKSGNYTDAEQRMIPVLSNRMLVTESMPFYVNGNQQRTFVFEKMKKMFSKSDKTFDNYKYTIEFTANPIWNVVQALPYLNTCSYDCNEQIFSKLYANSIAKKIITSFPEIQNVFQQWEQEKESSFLSQLEKNQELKSIAVEETPWLLEAKTETENKKQLAELFNEATILQQMQETKKQLEQAQNNDGGWSWFVSGKFSSFFITSHIVEGMGHLQLLGINNLIKQTCLQKAIYYLDKEMQNNYQLLKNANALNNYQITYTAVQYFYARTMFLSNIPVQSANKEMYNYFFQCLKKSYSKLNWYGQTLAALALFRSGETLLAEKIMNDIKNKAQYSDEMGMWWKKEGNGWLWYESTIERQALMIEAFETILKDEASVEKMQLWLLKQKQTQHWNTTKSTTEACYALLMRGQQKITSTDSEVKLSIGNQKFLLDTMSSAEIGSGYVKLSWTDKNISSEMATISIEKPTHGSSWGAAYWQYMENIDKITHTKSPLSLDKKMYKIINNDKGESLQEITSSSPIAVGDKICVRIVIKADRDMEYLHLKDMRASAFEPINVLSGYKYQDGLIYYESTKDAATHFFIEQIQKGTYVFEYYLFATQKGEFSNGIATLQCMYAPEFSTHSDGFRISVK